MNSILKRFLSTKTVKNVLHVTAKHTNESIVSTGSQNLVTKLEFSHNFKERNVWKETLVNYNTDHVAAKFRILSGNGNEKDKEIFEPIRVLASELNDTDLLVLSTPLWNFGLPYIMKQYVDIVIQPGKF